MECVGGCGWAPAYAHVYGCARCSLYSVLDKCDYQTTTCIIPMIRPNTEGDLKKLSN